MRENEASLGATEGALKLLHVIKKKLGESGSWKELLSVIMSEGLRAISLRPTSALLYNTVRELLLKAKELYLSGESIDIGVKSLVSYIDALEKSTVESVEKLGMIGARRLPEESVVLVHSYSTSVLKIIENGYRRGKVYQVYATESRPGGEGFFMAKMLAERGIRVNLIVDSAVNYFMGKIDVVLLGAEAIMANGALVNKIGSSMIALSASHKRARVHVASGTYKFSFESILGERMKIPRATIDRISPPQDMLAEKNIAFDLPLMDVTPPQYIDAIITESGVTSPQGVPIILWEKYGKWPVSLPDVQTIAEELRGLVERKYT